MNRDVAPLPGYPQPYGLLAAILQDGTREWREELPDELDADVMVWQPHAGMHSIGAIILHIASVEVSWFERFVMRLPARPEERKLLLSDEFDVDDWRWPEPPHQPLSWFYQVHDAIRARTLAGIQQWPDPDALCGDEDDARTPRWVLGHVIQHEAYHGGQAVLLQRLQQLQSD